MRKKTTAIIFLWAFAALCGAYFIARHLFEPADAKAVQNACVETSRRQSKMFLGLTDMEKVVVEQLRVGQRTLPKATIPILEEALDRGRGWFFLGMDNFGDIAIALDFKHNLFWVKDPPTEQP